MFNKLPPKSDGYPLEYLPAPILEAINDVAKITKAPIPLIAASALGAAATACQGLADVQRPTVPNPIPLSLNFLTIADSGERKSAADFFFFAPIYDFDKAQRAAYQDCLNIHSVNYAIWKAKEKGLQLRIQKTACAGQPTIALEKELRDLHSQQVQEPLRKRIVLSDITPAALSAELASNPCSAVLHSNEAADLIRGRAMGNLAFLNRAWDGQNIEIDRRDTTKSFVVEGARLTSVLAVQPDTFKILCEGKGGHARHSGYLARTLIAYPASTAGKRDVNILDGGENVPNGVQEFQEIIKILLTRAFNLDTHDKPRIVMTFSPQAKQRWVYFFNQIEVELRPEIGRFHRVKDFAAKAAEHTARMAAIFELISTESTVISNNSLNRAIHVVSWYLTQFDDLFGTTLAHNETQQNAEALLLWIKNKSAFYGFSGKHEFSRRKIMQVGPKATRCAENLDPVISNLVERGELIYTDFSKKSVTLNCGFKSNGNNFSQEDFLINPSVFSGTKGLLSRDCMGVIITT